MMPIKEKCSITPKEAASTFVWGDENHACQCYRMALGQSQSWKLLLPPYGPLAEECVMLLVSGSTETPVSLRHH